MKTFDQKQNAKVSAAANSPHFQQEGIASEMPPKQLFSEEEELKTEEENETTDKNFAGSGDAEIPPYDPNNNRNQNILTILERRNKEANKEKKPKKFAPFVPNTTPRNFRKVEPFKLENSLAFQNAQKTKEATEADKNLKTEPEQVDPTTKPTEKTTATNLPPTTTVQNPQNKTAPAVTKNTGANPNTSLPTGPENTPETENNTSVDEWKQKLNTTSSEVKKGETPVTDGAPATIEKKGQEIEEKKKAEQPEFNDDIKKSVSPTPEATSEPSIEKDPIEQQVNALITPHLDKKLQDLQLPGLNPTPSGIIPKLGDKLALIEDEIAKAKIKARALSIMGTEAQVSANEAKLQKLRELAATSLAETTGTAPTAEQLTLKQGDPTPRPPISDATKTDVKAILAKLLANPEGQATEMVTEFRKKAYKDNILQRVYPDIGKEEIPSLSQALTRELTAMAEEAGIGAEELEGKVAEQKALLETSQNTTEEQLDANLEKGKGKLNTLGEDEKAAIVGTKKAADIQREQQLEALNGESDPKLIKEKAARIKDDFHSQIGTQKVAYAQAKTKRHSQLDAALPQYIQAYRSAAIREEKTLEPDENGKKDPLQTADIRLWKDEQIRIVTKQFSGFKRSTTEAVTNFNSKLATAETKAVETINAWEETKTGEQKSWWARLFERFTNWGNIAKAEAEAWEVVKVKESTDKLIADVQLLEQAKAKLGENASIESINASKQLSQEQKDILIAYYSQGGAKDSISIVAASLKNKLKSKHQPQFRKKLINLIKAKPAEDWRYINQIARSTAPSFTAKQNAQDLYSAMKGGFTGLGTDEDKVYASLDGLNEIQRLAVNKCYKALYGASLKDHIKGEFSGAEEDRALAALNGETAASDAAALKHAMDGGWFFGAGTDESTIMKTLRGKSEAERQKIIDIYKKEYGEDLTAALKDELSSHELDQATALMDGDTAKADAIALDQAMNGGWFGIGTDEAAIDSTYDQIRKEVTAEAAKNKWNTAEMEAEIARRNNDVEAAYNAEYGDNYDLQEGESALRTEFADELSGGELDVANGLADNDQIKVDAARIAVERDSLIYADDDKINGLLQGQYTRALSELKRDGAVEMEQKLKDRQAKAEKESGEKWDSYRIAEEKRRIEAEMEIAAKTRASEYMTELESTYDEKYTHLNEYGQVQGLRGDLETYTSGHDGDKAIDLLDNGGYLSPAQELEYATKGVGTTESTVLKVFEGKTKDEIAQITKEWEERNPGRKLQDLIDGELSGRDEFDTEIAMRGLPKSMKEEIETMRDKVNWELENAEGAKMFSKGTTLAIGSLLGPMGGPATYLLGEEYIYENFFGGKQAQILADELAFMEEQYAFIQDPTLGDERDQDLAKLLYKQGLDNTQSSIKAYREQIDAVTNGAATVAALTAAIVVGVVLTALSGGAAGPAVAAFIGGLSNMTMAAIPAVAAVTAQVVTKRMLQGQAYGNEDIFLDLGIGAIDIAATIGSAGVGGIGLRALRGMGAGKIITLSKDPRLAARFFAHFVIEGTEGALSGLPSAFTGNLLNEQAWASGNPFDNIAKGVLKDVGMNTIISAGVGTKEAFGDINVGTNVDADATVTNTTRNQVEVVDNVADVNTTVNDDVNVNVADDAVDLTNNDLTTNDVTNTDLTNNNGADNNDWDLADDLLDDLDNVDNQLDVNNNTSENDLTTVESDVKPVEPEVINTDVKPVEPEVVNTDVKAVEPTVKPTTEAPATTKVEEPNGWNKLEDGSTNKKAIDAGLPNPAAKEFEGIVSDPALYSYRKNPNSPPPYLLAKKANSGAATLSLDFKGGKWTINAGKLSPKSNISALKAKLPKAKRAAFFADFGHDAGILAKFTANPRMLDAWNAMQTSPTLRKVVGNVESIAHQMSLHSAKVDDFKLKFNAASDADKLLLLRSVETFFGFKPGIFPEDIIAMSKGSRPKSMTDYLTDDFIARHSAKFNTEGASFIVVKSWTEGGNPKYKSMPPRKFVGLKSEMDKVIAKYKASGNDWKVLVEELNLGAKTNLETDEIFYVVIPPTDTRFTFEIPNGNEGGAIPGEWVPGGKTGSGTDEAALVGAEKIIHNKDINQLLKLFDGNWEQIK